MPTISPSRHIPMVPQRSLRTLAITPMVIVAVIALLNGCATLSQDECVTANWRTIGFEDGSQGKLASQVGKHRKACAKHGITPDLTAYQSGHGDGVKQFCTEPIGFNRGKRGGAYNGVCPDTLEAAFLAGYNKGKELYQLQQQVKQTTSTISSHKREINRLAKQIAAKEERLIRATTSESDRVILLKEIKELNAKQSDLEFDLSALEHDKIQQEAQYNALKQKYAR